MIRIGQCRQEELAGHQPQRPAIWATCSDFSREDRHVDNVLNLPQDFPHRCIEDHMSRWPAGRKTFTMIHQVDNDSDSQHVHSGPVSLVSLDASRSRAYLASTRRRQGAQRQDETGHRLERLTTFTVWGRFHHARLCGALLVRNLRSFSFLVGY